MIRPNVEVVLSLVDKITAPLRGTSAGVRGTFSDMTKSALGFVAGMASIGSIIGYMKASWEAADRFNQSLDRVAGTAKIMQVPLAAVQKTADDAQKTFGLSATAANNFASSAVTMAAKAGDVSKATDLMGSVLNLAAARGIKAEEALEALNITLKGQDEGLDKLVQRNPSAYYNEWAKAAGRSAGSLTDTEKALAIVDGLIRDGSRVRGAYVEWLDTTAGKAFLAGQASEMAAAKFGIATETLRIQLLSAKVWAAEALGGVVEFFQKVGVELALSWETTGIIVKRAIGGLQMAIGEFIAQNRLVLAFMPDAVAEMGEKLQDAGVKNKIAAEVQSREVSTIRKEMYAEIEGAHGAAQSNMLAQTEQSVAGQTDAVSKGAQKQREEATKAFEAIATAFREAYDPEQNPAITKARQAIEKINDALMKQPGLTNAQRTELQRVRQAYEDNIDSLEMGLGIERELVRVRDLPFQEEKLRNLNRLLEESIGFRDQEGASAETVKFFTAQIEAIQKEIKGELGQNVALQRSVADAARMAQYFYALASGDVVALAEGMAEVSDEGESAADKSDRIQKDLFSAARGTISIAKEMGAINAESAGVLNNVVTLAETIKGISADGLSMGGLVGIVGSVAGILGSIFAKNPQHEALFRKNYDALQALTRSNGLLLKAQSTGAQVEAAKGALPGLESLTFGGSGAIDATRFQGFRAALQAQGLTITDAEQLAKDMGIDLGIENGRITRQAIEDFITGLKTANFGSFEDSFGGFLDEMDFQGGLVGGFSAQEQLSRIKDGLGKDFGSSAISDAFTGIDLNSAEGRAALLQRLLGIGQNLGDLSDGQRGGLTGSEFTDILTRLTSLLRDMDENLPSTPTTGLGAPTTGAGEVPTTGGVAVPGAPSGLTAGISAGDSGLISSHLGKLVEQGATMIKLQERIATATEATAGRPNVAIGTINAGNATEVQEGLTKALDEALRIERDLAVLTRGG